LHYYHGMRHGEHIGFYRNGYKEYVEIYEHDKMIKETCFDEAGNEIECP